MESLEQVSWRWAMRCSRCTSTFSRAAIRARRAISLLLSRPMKCHETASTAAKLELTQMKAADFENPGACCSEWSSPDCAERCALAFVIGHQCCARFPAGPSGACVEEADGGFGSLKVSASCQAKVKSRQVNSSVIQAQQVQTTVNGRVNGEEEQHTKLTGPDSSRPNERTFRKNLCCVCACRPRPRNVTHAKKNVEL